VQNNKRENAKRRPHTYSVNDKSWSGTSRIANMAQTPTKVPICLQK
jgi:hypothetical protein